MPQQSWKSHEAEPMKMADIGLERKTGSKCPVCDKLFFSQTPLCDTCRHPTHPMTFHRRLFVERVSAMITLMLLGGIIALACTMDLITASVISLLVGLIVYLLYSAAMHGKVTGDYFHLYGRRGIPFLPLQDIFIERFTETPVPQYATLQFSWIRYVRELFYFVGPIIGLIVLVLLAEFIKKP